MDKEDRLQYMGHRLLERGFADWFKAMFKLIEDRPFIVEPIHPELFNIFQDIYNQKKIRVNINLPPRSAKTTLSKYFLVYGLTNNPKCNFIYTSYSQSLMDVISSELRDILEHPLYKKMYPRQIQYEEQEVDAIDDFWREYRLNDTNGRKNTYSSKKIVTYAGGTCLFASIGAQITGMGCGQRSAKQFSGALILDDANKPADIRSEIMREKVLRYYEETLLSRLNNPHVPIVNIQQRLHIEDLSGLLEGKYRFETIKRPLLDRDGKCLIPTQYTQERIKELQTNNYMFSAQYQQEPIILGGAVIKREWFQYYNPNSEHRYNRLIITADTAMKVKEYNDFSVFVVAGITPDNKMHIIDMRRGKWEAPELKKVAVELFEQYRFDPKTATCCSGLYVEDKASGVGLIQELQRAGIPIVGIPVDKDKLTRVESVLNYIASGQVLLPFDENHGFNPLILSECEAFTRDDSHIHDDIVDALVYAIQQGLVKNEVSLLDYFME